MSNSDPKSFNLQRMHLENEKWRMWMEPGLGGSALAGLAGGCQ
jgi:hypothetical protein